MQQHGPWTIVTSREVYADPWMRVKKDDVIRPDGKPGMHSVVAIRCGVTVLALDADGNVYLTEEFHYGVGRITLEGVSGGIEEGETPLDCARRELLEEVGLVAARWTDMGMVDPFTTSVVSPTRLYLAEDLSQHTSAPEGTEIIRTVKMSLAEAIRAVMDGHITHAPSCVVILKTWTRRC